MIWHYPTPNGLRWSPSKDDDDAWPISWAYHILKIRETADSLYVYNDGDFVVAYYNPHMELWRTESGMDFIKWKDVKRWAVLTDKDGNPVYNMED